MRRAAPTLLLGAALLGGCDPPAQAPTAPAHPFEVVAEVLLHPRCLNCHPSGEQPLIGDAGEPHGMRVERGPDGRGITTTVCSNCHQDDNLEGAHLPPGAPDWRMPSASTPLVFQGRSPAELCEQLRDPDRNGGKDLLQLEHHLTRDALVAWAWSPGGGRLPPPIERPVFDEAVRGWIAAGASCPPR